MTADTTRRRHTNRPGHDNRPRNERNRQDPHREPLPGPTFSRRGAVVFRLCIAERFVSPPASDGGAGARSGGLA